MKRDKVTMRAARKQRVRRNISGSPERPRMVVFRSNKYIYVQVINDDTKNTIVAASSLEKDIQAEIIEYKAKAAEAAKAKAEEEPKVEEAPAKGKGKGKGKEKKKQERPLSTNMFASQLVGKMAAERAIEKGVKQVVFDRSGYKYHGRVKMVGDSARKAGLDF